MPIQVGHFLSTCPKLNLYNVAMNRKTEIKKMLPSLCGVVTGSDRIEEVTHVESTVPQLVFLYPLDNNYALL